ncbi:Hpt domain-containing protein, partial [Nodosilinea sp. LEGE 07088]|uniref:Hpt domain-containing protein n=1 Tax=Nodosilinea sp. LEGE 07088 TaxID=2777968 RepID=UPI0018818851
MATNPHIRDQAYQFFLEEAPELLQTIETGLLTLGQQRDTAEIHQIMRAAHSLKGGAASVGLEPIKAIAHRLEALFKALYSETVVVDSELESQLLRAFDCLRLPLTQQLTEGTFNHEQAMAMADSVLQDLEQHLASAMAETENFIPSSSDLGFDMATSIFEIDVQQGLDHLTRVLENPQAHEVAGELRAQAEIFMGFAELLDLSGFAQIAETALQALAANPDQAVDIARLAIADFRQGREAVLTARSTTGGEPSMALQALAVATSGSESLPEPSPELPLEPASAQFLTSVFGDGDPDWADSTWGERLPSVAEPLAWPTQPQPSVAADRAIPLEPPHPSQSITDACFSDPDSDPSDSSDLDSSELDDTTDSLSLSKSTLSIEAIFGLSELVPAEDDGAIVSDLPSEDTVFQDQTLTALSPFSSPSS